MLNMAHDFVFTYFKLASLDVACAVSYTIAYVVRWDKCFTRIAGNTAYP